MEIARLKDHGLQRGTTEVDRVLVHRAAVGDEQAQRELICRFSDRVNRTCRYLIGPNDAEDMAQNVFMQILKSAAGFRGESSLDYWVDRITIRTVAKQFKKNSRRKELVGSMWEPGPEVVSIEQQVDVRDVRHRLVYHFSSLSEKQRRAVVLHYLFGYELAEIADLLDAKVNAVRSRLRKGLAKLRRNILTDPHLRDWVGEGRI